MTNLEHATALLAGANYCGNEQTPSGAACARCIARVLEDAYARGFAEAREMAAKRASAHVDDPFVDGECTVTRSGTEDHDSCVVMIVTGIRALVPNAGGEQGG